MKIIKNFSLTTLTAFILTLPLAGVAADAKKSEVRPYKLEKCIVTGEKLGEMGKPFVFAYKGQEFKLCCKNCKKDFDKDPAKYVKKLAEEVKKAEAAKKSNTEKQKPK